MSNEMAEKAMKLVATMDRTEKHDDKDDSGDKEEIQLREEGMNMAAEEIMDAFKNNDVNELVLSLKNFLSIAKS